MIDARTLIASRSLGADCRPRRRRYPRPPSAAIAALVDERVHQLAAATAEAALHELQEVDRMRLAFAHDLPTVQIQTPGKSGTDEGSARRCRWR